MEREEWIYCPPERPELSFHWNHKRTVVVRRDGQYAEVLAVGSDEFATATTLEVQEAISDYLERQSR